MKNLRPDLGGTFFFLYLSLTIPFLITLENVIKEFGIDSTIKTKFADVAG